MKLINEPSFDKLCKENKMMGSRRKARVMAIQVLYEVDAVKRDIDTVLEAALSQKELSQENSDFVRYLTQNVIEQQAQIDAYIKEYAPAWPLEQLSIIDRNILRLAVFEVLIDDKTPVKVAINEAVELAKKFGSNSSSKFINGVLSSVSAIADNKN